ncbi:MAG: immunoglobulin domain-containing protein [Opitutales bacterium]|nr:immunoglobulin domain-containing protein [Opitutales bacterium]
MLVFAVQSISAAVIVTGKAPVVSGISTGVVTLSNRNYVYTAHFDANGTYRFDAVEPGIYSLKADVNGYNQVGTISVDATVNVTVPDLAIDRYSASAGTYQYTWTQDQSYAGLPKTEVTQNVVTPVSVTILGTAYQIADIGYAQELFNKYGIVLNNADMVWNQEYAYRLYSVLERIPQVCGSTYQYNQVLSPRQWTLTTDFINGDIEFGPGSVRISTAAFTYAAPFVAEIQGVRGLYFSKRLHHALVNYVTNQGADQAAVAKILSDRFGLTIDTDANRLDYTQFTTEATTRFQKWFVHPAEIVEIINQFEELPEGFHKIVGFKWLVRRLDGTVNPMYPAAPAVAWTNGYMEFMETAFSGFDIANITRLILHEKAHYIYQFLLTTDFKKAWTNLGGWQYTPDLANPNYSASDGWKTTKTTEFVSAYAHDNNPNEDFAETVACFVKDPDILKARSIGKYNFMKDNVMFSNSYVSVIRPDLTFTVLNLYPTYDYPGKIKRVATTVTGGPTEDKTFTLELEITPFSTASTPVNDIYMRISSPVTPSTPVATYFDLTLAPINIEKTIFRRTVVLSKYLRRGYWQTPNITIIDTAGLQRYESSVLYGFKLYLDNPLEDTTPPAVVPNSTSISIRPGTMQGHPVQIATVKFNVTENTGLIYHYAALVPPGAYRMEQYGSGPTDGSGERTIEFYIKEFGRTGRYTLNQIALKDYGLNLNYTYFKTSSGNSDGTTVNLDENAPYIDVVTPHPDTAAPELDVNRITVTAVPTNLLTPDGETLVTIKYYVRDDASGYGTSSNFKLRDPQGLEHSDYLYHRNFHTQFFDGDPTQWEQYTQQIILPRGSVPGVWGLSQMTLGDKAGNMKSYDFTETVRFDPNSTAASDLLIIGDPVSRSYVSGETFSLSIQAAGGDNVAYEWFKDGVSLLPGRTSTAKQGIREHGISATSVVLVTGTISGADTPNLKIENASQGDSGTYYCVISNAAGRVVSNAATLSVSASATAPSITTQPSNQTVTAGGAASFTVAASGSPTPTYQWAKGGVNVAGATSASYSISAAASLDAGDYTVVVSNTAGSVTSNVATLTVNVMPGITSGPITQAVYATSSLTLSVSASGTAPMSYQWYRDGMAISGATSSTYTISSAVFGDAGTYTVKVTNGAGSVTSSAATLTIVEMPTRLTNLSVRIGAGTGDNTLIVGFVVSGAGTSGAKPLLIRAVGPTLASYGVTGTLIDPNLELIAQGASTALASNDNWGGNVQVTSVGNPVGAFPLSSALSKDAALYLTPSSGVYTAKVTGVGGTSGIALAEIYDASGSAYSATTPRLTNVSARAQVGTGDGVLIAGFVVDGTASRTVLIRAVGPTLGTYGVGGVLADPQLELTRTVNAGLGMPKSPQLEPRLGHLALAVPPARTRPYS